MILLVQPWRFNEDQQDIDPWQDLAGVVMALIAAFFSACSMVFIRKLSKGQIHFAVNNFYFMLGNLLLCPF